MHRKRTKGAAMLEFAFIAPLFVTLITGTLIVGTGLLSNLQVTQVTRDTASMYGRGVDFSDTTNQQLVARLGQELGLQPSGGNAVVILSTIEYITSAECAAYAGQGCNAGNWVFTNRVSFGNTGLRSSNYGSPSCTLDSSGNVAPVDSVTNACSVVSGFSLLGTPSAGTDGFKPGQQAYMAEVYALNGWGHGSYAFAIF